MGILIKGLELPEGHDTMLEVAIFGDGEVLLKGKGWKNPEDGKFYYTSVNPERFYSAVSSTTFDL